MLFGHLYVLFGQMSVQVFCPFFHWIVSFIIGYMSCLYILEINPLLLGLFANIFCYSESCLFVLFIVSFIVQKVLSLIRSYFVIFVFIFTILGDGSKKIFL